MKATTQRTTVTRRDYDADDHGKAYRIDLGLIDARGRAIGLYVRTSVVRVVAVPERETSGNYAFTTAGTYFGVYCQVTRNGDTFGATRDTVLFTESSETVAYVKERIAAAVKRYVKNGAAKVHDPDEPLFDSHIVNHHGDTVDSMRELFDGVSAPENWKNPLEFTVDRKDVGRYMRAIQWFVGGPTFVVRQKGEAFTLGNHGYYHNIGA